MTLNLRTICDLWSAFGDIPVDDDYRIEESFMGFPIGTDKEDIWHWFDGFVPVYRLLYEFDDVVAESKQFDTERSSYDSPSGCLHTVTVDFVDSCVDTWTAVFSNSIRAVDFADKIEDVLKDCGINHRIVFDGGTINDTSYLEFAKEHYGEE